MNDSQVQEIVRFLESRNMVIRIALTDHDMRIKMNLPYSLSTKYLVYITKTGQKYLNMLLNLESQIDWTRHAKWIVKKRH